MEQSTLISQFFPELTDLLLPAITLFVEEVSDIAYALPSDPDALDPLGGIAEVFDTLEILLRAYSDGLLTFEHYVLTPQGGVVSLPARNGRDIDELIRDLEEYLSEVAGLYYATERIVDVLKSSSSISTLEEARWEDFGRRYRDILGIMGDWYRRLDELEAGSD